MTRKTYTVVGIGEVLWDCFPGVKHLGGAPFNFAYHASVLGDRGVFIGRAGRDANGKEVESACHRLGMDPRFLQLDAAHPTGTVEVTLKRGQPDYVIRKNVAWDYLRLTAAAKQLAKRADAVCFGTLAQRRRQSRQAIHAFLRHAWRALVTYDINLRQRFFSRSIIEASLHASHILKINGEEVATLKRLFKSRAPLSRFLDGVIDDYRLELVCVTLGRKGCLVRCKGKTTECPGYKVKLADSVGAGDVFAAAFIHKRLRHSSLAAAAEFANRVAALVVSRPGGTPTYNRQDIKRL